VLCKIDLLHAGVVQGYWEAEQDSEKKAQAKRQERVIKQWTRLVQGLRIRQRLQEQYAGRSDASTPEIVVGVGARDHEADTDHVESFPFLSPFIESDCFSEF
jgi:hypothetical protein